MWPEQAPTRAAVLELGAERLVVEEAYEFLDEKRLLLAAELLQELRRYEGLLAELEEGTRQANKRLAAAVQRHGLQGLAVYPAAVLDGARVETSRRNLMGVGLQETGLRIPEAGGRAPASNPSPEADQCAEAFRVVVERSAVLAGISGNLYRLYAEYRLTERRARALENIILPEIEQALRGMNARLEEQDLEDRMRARRLANVPA
jgi:V/A-type H+-transporting ATPase subunit D